MDQKCYAAGLKMLCRREHSIYEMQSKLGVKGFSPEDISEALALLIEQKYQSEDRFVEAFVQMRINQGKGPVRISIDLKQRGIEYHDLSLIDWYALARIVKVKKYGEDSPSDYKEIVKQKLFLQSRGFNFDHINTIFE